MPLSRRSLFALNFSGRSRAAGAWLRVHRTSMACRFEISLPVTDTAHVDAARKALEESDRVETMLGTLRETSEAGRLNRHVGRVPIPASPDFFALLQYCAQLHDETAGAFDIEKQLAVRILPDEFRDRCFHDGRFIVVIRNVGAVMCNQWRCGQQ